MAAISLSLKIQICNKNEQLRDKLRDDIRLIAEASRHFLHDIEEADTYFELTKLSFSR